MMPMPGLLAPLTGCTVEDFTFIGPADEKEYMTLGEKKIPAPTFNDILRPDLKAARCWRRMTATITTASPR